MNFIAASLAYHCDSVSTFWLFTSLIEDYGLRKNYLKGLEGFYERAESIGELVKKNIPKIYNFLKKNNVTFDMITLEPVMSLFCNLIPLRESKYHLENFFEKGWSYFNSLFVKFLESISAQLFKCEDLCDILSLFKDHYNCRGDRRSTWSQRMAQYSSSTADSFNISEIDWEELCNKA